MYMCCHGNQYMYSVCFDFNIEKDLKLIEISEGVRIEDIGSSTGVYLR